MASQSLISSNTLPSFDDVEAEYQKLIASANTPTPEPKKRGRKKKEETQAPAEAVPDRLEIDPNIIKDAVALPLDFLFVRMKRKPLAEIEKKALAGAFGKVAEKYLPIVAGKFQEELALAICLGSIFASRMKPVEEKKDETVSK